ncbi:hypothetical protein CC78DRAFT_600098 [Lojkania enalia]|uniref:Uncharacterized protein n=1 Tax=Lojkania enalia TaxID=147567 RepID=A0A9P4KBW1_9PLEO|nr:hypothetical protein CC78DRAFT_600098 [Didymosphaeria enalia]
MPNSFSHTLNEDHPPIPNNASILDPSIGSQGNEWIGVAIIPQAALKSLLSLPSFPDTYRKAISIKPTLSCTGESPTKTSLLPKALNCKFHSCYRMRTIVYRKACLQQLSTYKVIFLSIALVNIVLMITFRSVNRLPAEAIVDTVSANLSASVLIQQEHLVNAFIYSPTWHRMAVPYPFSGISRTSTTMGAYMPDVPSLPCSGIFRTSFPVHRK